MYQENKSYWEINYDTDARRFLTEYMKYLVVNRNNEAVSLIRWFMNKIIIGITKNRSDISLKEKVTNSLDCDVLIELIEGVALDTNNFDVYSFKTTLFIPFSGIYYPSQNAPLIENLVARSEGVRYFDAFFVRINDLSYDCSDCIDYFNFRNYLNNNEKKSFI